MLNSFFIAESQKKTPQEGRYVKLAHRLQD